MAMRNIVKFGDPMLKKHSRTVEKFDDRLAQLIDDMKETMYANDGCGLAAVQVGILKRVVVLDVGEGPIELVNPEIIFRDGEHFHLHGALAEGDLDHVADLHLIRSLGRLAVDRDARCIACIIRHRAALDQAGYLQILV